MINFTYKGQQLKKWVPVVVLALLGILVVTAIVAVATRPKAPIAEWTRGYEAPTGQYMQPDHSYLYYWMARNLLWSDPQPTYTPYTPPPGYAPNHRPWYGDNYPTSPRYIPPNQRPAPSPTRTSGGFSTPSPAKPSSVSPSRTSGGFSQPSKSSPSRTSGGFSQPSRPAPSAARPAPSSPSRTNGGFSRPSSPSPSRTSGGFGKAKSGGS